jgi:hypothetical protein
MLFDRIISTGVSRAVRRHNVHNGQIVFDEILLTGSLNVSHRDFIELSW